MPVRLTLILAAMCVTVGFPSSVLTQVLPEGLRLRVSRGVEEVAQVRGARQGCHGFPRQVAVSPPYRPHGIGDADGQDVVPGQTSQLLGRIGLGQGA